MIEIYFLRGDESTHFNLDHYEISYFKGMLPYKLQKAI